jgi:hypothetical protein
MDDMLLWIKQSSERDCELAKCQPGEFYCGRKKKFGLNLQGVFNHKGEFIDFFIGHPDSTSDFLFICTSSLKNKLERSGFLKAGMCIFGNNAYVNTNYMATPFKAVYSGQKDDYNFYHSQVRITIKCAFGMLVNKWGILRRAIPNVIGYRKTTALAMVLCHLYNYCIDRQVLNEEGTCMDNFNVESLCGVHMAGVPNNVSDTDNLEQGRTHFHEELMAGRDHCDNHTRYNPLQVERQELNRSTGGQLPRERLLEQVIDCCLT